MRILVSQLDVFRQSRLRQFEAEMLAHIQEHFPEHHQAIPEAARRRTIRLARSRAANHGLVSVRSVCIFLNSMLWLGSYFDTDVQYPWAREALNGPPLNDQKAKATRLADASVRYMLRLAGPDNRHFGELVDRLRRDGDTYLNARTTGRSSSAVEILASLFPEKAELIGADTLLRLVHSSKDQAARHGLLTEECALAYVILMYLIGSGFDADPQFGWAEPILKDRASPPEQRARMLLRTGLEQLDKITT
jgi:hypothetical protein